MPPTPSNEGIPVGAGRVETPAEALYRRLITLEKAVVALQAEVASLRPVRAVSTHEVGQAAAVPLDRRLPLAPLVDGVTAHGVTVGRTLISGRYRTVVDLPAPNIGLPEVGNFTLGGDQPPAMGCVDMRQAARDAVLVRPPPVQPGETIRVAWGGDAAAKDPI